MVHRSSYVRTFIASLLALSLSASTASADHHRMQIEQVIGGVNGDTTAQAVQLRMRSTGQHLVSQSRVYVHDAEGEEPILLVDMTTNVNTGQTGRRVLITTPAFNAYLDPSVTPDFTMVAIPASYLAAGSITFEDDFGTIWWRLSWGGAGYTGSNLQDPTNHDGNGNVAPPFPGPLPSSSTQALRFINSATAFALTNAGDYAVTTGAATFTNNANVGGVVTADDPTVACCTTASLCEDITMDACVAADGTPRGPDTACATIVPCDVETVACCTGVGVCEDLIAVNCFVPLGTGTSCFADGAACSLGACCIGSACQETTDDQCVAYICDVNELQHDHEGGMLCGQAPGGCCFGDADGNGFVNPGDRGFVAANIGQTDDDLICLYDIDGNGFINPGDRGFIAANIGICAALPDYQNGSGMNGGALDMRFAAASFEGYGTNCIEVPCE